MADFVLNALDQVRAKLASVGLDPAAIIGPLRDNIKNLLDAGNLDAASQLLNQLSARADAAVSRTHGASGLQRQQPPPRPRAEKKQPVLFQDHLQDQSLFNADLTTGEPSARILQRDRFRDLSYGTGPKDLNDFINHTRGVHGVIHHPDVRSHVGKRVYDVRYSMLPALHPHALVPGGQEDRHTLPYLAHPRDLNEFNSLKGLTDRSLRNICSEEADEEYYAMTRDFNREFLTKPLHFKDNLKRFGHKTLMRELKQASAAASHYLTQPNTEDLDPSDELKRRQSRLSFGGIDTHHKDAFHIPSLPSNVSDNILARVKRQGHYTLNHFKEAADPDRAEAPEQHETPGDKLGPGDPPAELPTVQTPATEELQHRISEETFPTQPNPPAPTRPPDPTLEDVKTPEEQKHPTEHTEVPQAGAQPPEPSQLPQSRKRKRANRVMEELRGLGVTDNHMISDLPHCGHEDAMHRRPPSVPRNALCALHRTTKRLKLTGEIPQPGSVEWRKFRQTLRTYKS